MKILYFGQLVDATQTSHEELNGIENLTALKNFVESKYPALKDKTYIFSVNQIIKQEAELHESDEVALMPPFSGG